MSGASGPAPRRQWWLRPSIALPAVSALIALAAILTPQPQDARSGDSRLSTYSASPRGAKLLYELADRLGWATRRQLATGVPRDSSAIVALLAPTVPISDTEAHAILEHVRRGGGLLYVLPQDSPLSDSLGLRRSGGDPAFVRGEIGGPVDDECRKETNGALSMWPGDEDVGMRLWALQIRRRIADTVVFVETRVELPFRVPNRAQGDSALAERFRPRPAAVGFPLGAGRVVAIADPDLLRNDVLRVCRWGADVAAVRMLEYLSPDARRTVVFDEFHQGYGNHPGTFTAIARFFGATPEGHALGQLMLAGLVLLVAHAPRLVPPRDTERIERRSPTEHVQALARAYEKVGATRTAVLRLVHGLRRRVARLGAPPLDEGGGAAALFDWIVQRAPDAADDVAVVRQALAHPVSSRDLVRAAAAIRRLEAALTQSSLFGSTSVARRPSAPAPTAKP